LAQKAIKRGLNHHAFAHPRTLRGGVEPFIDPFGKPHTEPSGLGYLFSHRRRTRAGLVLNRADLSMERTLGPHNFALLRIAASILRHRVRNQIFRSTTIKPTSANGTTEGHGERCFNRANIEFAAWRSKRKKSATR
jgi:hypothetical protein